MKQQKGPTSNSTVFVASIPSELEKAAASSHPRPRHLLGQQRGSQLFHLEQASSNLARWNITEDDYQAAGGQKPTWCWTNLEEEKAAASERASGSGSTAERAPG